MYGEVERMWKGAVVVKHEKVSRNLRGGAEEKQEKSYRR
jgi:hypothetical protein